MGYNSARYPPRRQARAKAQAINTPDPTYFLAIESGGSGTRLALADVTGRILCQEHCDSASPLYRNSDHFSANFSAALERILHGMPPHSPPIAAVGTAGPADRALILDIVQRALPGLAVQEYSEGDLARGLHGVTAGVALVAGTGCSCSAIDEAGTLTSLGGYGPQFGDEGSAYWIGREGLKAAFLSEQNRIAPTALLPAARYFYKIASPWGLLKETEGSGHVPAPRVAAFAVEVDRAAESGDTMAAGILEEAGAHLGRLIIETAELAGFDFSPVPLAMAGGALRSKRLLESIRRTLAAGGVPFLIHPVVHEPIAGLIALLRQTNKTEKA